jgi:hypothetical protein
MLPEKPPFHFEGSWQLHLKLHAEAVRYELLMASLTREERRAIKARAARRRRAANHTPKELMEKAA